jgi:predicted transposase YbfD/YdcC
VPDAVPGDGRAAAVAAAADAVRLVRGVRDHLPGRRDPDAGAALDRKRQPSARRGSHARYFIGSKRAKARYYAQRMRGHWRVENNLHWQLDVTFREDDSRIRQRTAATNFAVVRRLALNLAKHEDTQMSIAKKRFAAALDTDYLEKILEVGKLG